MVCATFFAEYQTGDKQVHNCLTRNAIRMVTRPPKILKKHEATPAMPRQLGPMGSMANALAARVMLAAAIPEHNLRPMYHQVYAMRACKCASYKHKCYVYC